MKKQRLLFPQDSLLPEKLPQIQELRPSNNLLAVFEECHNYIYLFNSIKNHYRGFFTDDTFKLKPLTLAYIVGKLQYINLTKTSGDIKGEAFQTFVNKHQRGDRGSPRQATALITEDEDGAICSNGFSVLRNIQGVEPLFLLVYMRTDFFFASD
jgi:hypothetical protein